jgi:7tm Chemosensory receptor.
MQFQFLNIVLLLKQYFSYINSQLISGTNLKGKKRMEEIKRCLKLHSFVCEIAREVNFIFAPSLLCGFCNNFLCLTYAEYFILQKLMGFDVYETYLCLVFTTVQYVGMLLVVTLACSLCYSEVRTS